MAKSLPRRVRAEPTRARSIRTNRKQLSTMDERATKKTAALGAAVHIRLSYPQVRCLLRAVERHQLVFDGEFSLLEHGDL